MFRSPSFSPIVERHLYYYIIVSASSKFRSAGHGFCLKPSHVTSKRSTPGIANHVRVLQIALKEGFYNSSDNDTRELENLPALETFLFTNKYSFSWQKVPLGFKKVLESFLCWPTLHNLHFDGRQFPLSILYNNPNTDCLSLSGSPEIPVGPTPTSSSNHL